MKTNFLCLLLGLLVTSALPVPAQTLSEGLLAGDGVDSFSLAPEEGDADRFLWVPASSSLEANGLDTLSGACRGANASVAMDFVEVTPETVSSLLAEPTATVEAAGWDAGPKAATSSGELSGPVAHDWLVLRDQVEGQLTPVPEPAIYFFGVFAAILFVLDRRRPLS